MKLQLKLSPEGLEAMAKILGIYSYAGKVQASRQDWRKWRKW